MLSLLSFLPYQCYHSNHSVLSLLSYQCYETLNTSVIIIILVCYCSYKFIHDQVQGQSTCIPPLIPMISPLNAFWLLMNPHEFVQFLSHRKYQVGYIVIHIIYVYCIYIYMYISTDWWFGTFFIFPSVGNFINPN